MNVRLLIALGTVGATTPVGAQWAVFDAAGLSQSVTNYAALVEQIANQAEQISHQVRQIAHMEDQLRRMGDMADFTAIVGFPEFHIDVRLPTKIRTWDESIILVDGYGIFEDSRDGIFEPISVEFPDFDGVRIAREPVIFKPVHEVTVKVDEFKEVQADVYSRRAVLREAIAATSEALRTATTEAEAKKLEAILDAQYAQLAALDSEVVLSAAEIQVKAAEAHAMETAQDKADAEARRKLAQQEAGKIAQTYTPIYKCLLQYVSEEPFQP